MLLRLFTTVLLLSAGSMDAQESASFKLSATLNSGGHPTDGSALNSAGYGITLDAIGDSVASTQSSSASFLLEGGFVGTFAPPGEVTNVRFSDSSTLEWDAERSAGDYALYSGDITAPFDSAYGTCHQPPPPLTSTNTVVTATPLPGEVTFFLVTARNRLGEEGSKGTGTTNPRPNPAPCP